MFTSVILLKHKTISVLLLSNEPD